MRSKSDKKHILLVNGLVFRQSKLLISQRSFTEINEPGNWTIPGGKVEQTRGNVWNIIEETLTKEIKEETGITINKGILFLTNNTFIRSTGEHVVALIFICGYKSGKAVPLDDTIDVKWISAEEINCFQFSENVGKYIQKGFKFWLSRL